MSKITMKDLHDKQEAVQDAIKQYLRDNGWDYTCTDTGSLWLWQKLLKDGRTVLMNQQGALTFQEYNPKS